MNAGATTGRDRCARNRDGSLLQRRFRGIIVFALAIILAIPAMAHRTPGVLTTIQWNASTGHTEIVHRLHVHDAELGIGQALGIPDLRMMDMEARARAALYVESQFAIAAGNGELALALVGAELEGQYLLVYQEYPSRLAGHIRIRNDTLRGVFEAQVNQVFIQDGGAVHTLTFAGDETWLEYRFRD